MSFKKVLDKIKTQAIAIKAKMNEILNTAFPEPVNKYIFLTALTIIELLIAYGIACFDIGLWQGDCSLSGIVAGYWLHDRRYPLFLFLLLGIVLIVLLFFYMDKVNNGNTGRGFSISESNVYGSARDINLEELQQVADIVPKEKALGTIYGQLDKTEQRLVTAKNLSNYNRNFLAVAPPGYGKTFCIVLPFLVQCILRGESAIVTDTKGEVWAKTVELARRYGYTVRRIDFKNPKCSDGWDILAEIQMDDIRAKTISQIIMENTGNDKDIHKSAEEALLTAVCLYTALHPDIPDKGRNLHGAYSMLHMGAAALDATFKDIMDDPTLRVAYEYYANFVQGSENLRGNIITNLANRLSVLSSPGIKQLTSVNDIDLTLPGRQKCIYYVELHDQVNSQRFLSSLFFSFVFWDLCDYADAQPDQRLPVYCNILIEEAYACGYLPTITNAMATVRSRAMGVGLIVQGIEQLRILYGPETTETILNCCATQLCLGTNANSTAELFEWLSGTATVKVKTEQHSVGEGPLRFGKGYSTGDGRQSLYSGNDIRKIKFERILLVPGRFDPILLHTFGINRHPEFLNGHMPQISGNTHVPLMDEEARAFLKAQEEQRVEDFEAWVAEGNDPRADDKTSEKRKRPRVIPYPELEKMALAHSKQATDTRKANLVEEMKGTAPIEPADAIDYYSIPDEAWEDACDYDEDDEDDIIEFNIPETEEEPIQKPNTQQPREATVSDERPNPNDTASATTDTYPGKNAVVLDVNPKPTPESLFGLPGHQKKPDRSGTAEKILGGSVTHTRKKGNTT